MEKQMNLKGNAYFAVKKRSKNERCAPILVAIMESYDAAIKMTERRNKDNMAEQPYYASIHHG